MARRIITDAMRETARSRAYGYLAARGMSAGEVTELASYHSRQARAGSFTGDARTAARVTARMLGNLAARKHAGTWYIAPQRASRGRHARTR